jgi:hypothetical protein
MKTVFNTLLTAALLFTPLYSGASEYYRYKAEDGTLMINTYIPPEYIKQGYEVITSRGQVLKVVPPAPTEEELAKRDAEKKRKEELLRLAAEQRKVDMRLQKLYSHPDDARSAMKRKLSEMDYQVSRKRGQISAMAGKKEKLEGKAAAQERAGQTVSEQLVEDIARLERQINDELKLIEDIERDKEIIRKTFQKDIDRMVELMKERNSTRQVDDR